MKKLLLEKTLFFVVSMGIVALLFITGSYYFFLNTYEQLETSHNKKHLTLLIQHINHALFNLRQKNLEYISLMSMHNKESHDMNKFPLDVISNDQSIDFIIQTDKNNKILLQKTNKTFNNASSNLFNTIIQKYEKNDKISDIYPLKKNLLFISKESLSFNNEKEYLYIAKEISEKNLKNFAPFFNTISFSKKTNNEQKTLDKFSSAYFPTISLYTKKQSDNFFNQLNFFNNEKQFVFALQTNNKRDIVATGEQTIYIFIGSAIFFLIIIFLISRKYMNTVKMNNEVLEQEVERRTHQIQSALNELEKVNLKLYDIAHTDFLTKTRNRRNFFIHSENIFSNSIKEEKELAVIMIDIDNFKPFNDNYGHAVGDQILIMFSNCVKACLDDSDIFGRLGGEEFAITLYDVSLEVAMEKAEKIRAEIEKLELHTASKKLTVTASFGVSDKTKCESLDQMLQKADKLLYSAKHSGKNKVRSRLNTP